MTETMTATAAPSPLLRYFQVVGRSRTWLTVLWMLLGLPLGVAAFTYAVTISALGLGLAITIVGIPLLIAFLFSVRAMAAVEGRLAAFLLGAEIPKASFAAASQAAGLFARMGACVTRSRGAASST